MISLLVGSRAGRVQFVVEGMISIVRTMLWHGIGLGSCPCLDAIGGVDEGRLEPVCRLRAE